MSVLSLVRRMFHNRPFLTLAEVVAAINHAGKGSRDSFEGGRRRNGRLRRSLAGVALACALLVVPASSAQASLQLLDPTSSGSTFIGNGGYSADGLGQIGTGGVVRAEVPGGSTVVGAYLYGTYYGNLTPSLSDRTINFDGTNVVMTKLAYGAPGGSQLSTARADVTSQVAAKVGGGGGITTFAINTDPPTLDGVALVVLYSNPSSSFKTIAVFDGGAEQAGDTASFTFSQPLDPGAPGFAAQMSLGIGFSFQGAAGGHSCDTGVRQSSTVDVNAARLTSCAGNYDDGAGANGALITVGGVSDSLDNPADPFQLPADGKTPRVTDDELYNLVPFINLGDTQLKIDTKNASNDDNVFLAVISANGAACVTVSSGTCTPPPPPPPPPPAPAPAPAPTPTPKAKDTTAPKIAVKGVAAANGGCRSGDFTASLTVREASLKRVDVFLDGKRIKRTSKKSATFRIAAANLTSGNHSVKVVATDKSGNRSTRTSSFTRCVRKAVVHRLPRFTG